MATAAAGARCLNCGALLDGSYCACCGQKHEPDIHTLAHFSAEAFESITHADSRLWRTIGSLLTKPGVLTREFFAGRRARYLPPVRFYLVVSLLFFFLVGITSRDSDDIVNFDVKSDSATIVTAGSGGLDLCVIKYDGPFAGWVQKRWPEQCRKIRADGGRGLGQLLIQNLPKALFVLLPLLAALMMLLYWRPRRYYVEHLLLLLHNHINVFLGYSVLVVLGMWFPDSGALDLLAVGMQFWLLWYIYRAMRNFYGQGRWRTSVKFLSMLLVYFVLGVSSLAITMAFSAMTL